MLKFGTLLTISILEARMEFTYAQKFAPDAGATWSAFVRLK